LSTILKSETSDRRKFIRLAFEKFNDQVPSGKILVKPNIVSHEKYPTTTHPDVLDEVLVILSDREVIVGDGAAADIIKTGKVIRDHGLAQIAKKHGHELLNFYDRPMVKHKAEDGLKFSYSDAGQDVAGIISLPVLKVHKICMMTGAIKNHFGFFSRKDRAKLHFGKSNIHKAIAEVCRLTPPSLVIVDAVETLVNTNEVRHGGKPHELGFMLAGTDPVALDACGLELLQGIEPGLQGKTPAEVPYIKYAAEAGLGSFEYDVENI
jgi:uncharacterized protein (DUF362 family)